MRAALIVGLALFAGAANARLDMAVENGVMLSNQPKLHKPVIVNPLETPAVAENLAGISKILGAEPAAAADPAAENSGDGDGEDEGMDDVALMGQDDCDSPLPSEKCKKKGEESSAESSAPPAAESSAESSEESSAESSAAPAAESSAESSAPTDKTQSEINSLEKLISSAMKISKAIPEKVKRLEQLKNKEEHMTEDRARAEAEKTLKEHGRLLEEMKTHIEKLGNKLAELKKKRQELVESDARLRATLQGKPVKAEESAEEKKAESSEESKKE